MENYAEILRKFDISPTAANVYIALLDLGKASADKIAKKAKTYKANTYDALARLEEIGLATAIIEQNKRFFLPTNPIKLDQILEELRNKETERIDLLKRDLNKIIPELKAKYDSIKEKNLFEIYRGRKAYKSIIDEISLEKPKIWEGFGNLQVQSAFPIEFKKWFKNCTIKLFSTKSDEVLKRLEEAKKTTKVEIKWLPSDVFMPIVWVIFGYNVLIIIYEPEVIVLRIKSKQIVETFSNQFGYLWNKY